MQRETEIALFLDKFDELVHSVQPKTAGKCHFEKKALAWLGVWIFMIGSRNTRRDDF